MIDGLTPLSPSQGSQRNSLDEPIEVFSLQANPNGEIDEEEKDSRMPKTMKSESINFDSMILTP